MSWLHSPVSSNQQCTEDKQHPRKVPICVLRQAFSVNSEADISATFSGSSKPPRNGSFHTFTSVTCLLCKYSRETPVKGTALGSITTRKSCKLSYQMYSGGHRISPKGHKSSWKPLIPRTSGIPSSVPFLLSYPSRLQCLFFLKYVSNCFQLENIFQNPLALPGANVLVPVRIGAQCSAPLTFLYFSREMGSYCFFPALLTLFI